MAGRETGKTRIGVVCARGSACGVRRAVFPLESWIERKDVVHGCGVTRDAACQ
jgi:hypothetical protein